MAETATKAQMEALRWLVANGQTERVRGGSFIDYYHERWKREHPDSPGTFPTTSRQHAYRRTGGRVLAGLAQRGLVKMTRFEWGLPEYKITEAGLEAVRVD